SYRIEFRRSAERDIRRISPIFIPRILARVAMLGDDPLPRQAVKLTEGQGMYRLRVGAYRVIYEVDAVGGSVMVHYIRHRREAYRRV
ncbi:MAG TPA: type II toxin-antitoxin system RelE/ParE family toxin, partial [Dehalococcoidia bacterium]|nr:type II toxin-antitoxin system RelE/ParE family toxin [Dehalococcoidia bacterium]